MKISRLITLFIIAVLIATPLYAQSTNATFGNQNSSGEYRVEANTNGTITFASDTSIKFPYQSGTTNDTLTVADSGRTYVVTYDADTQVSPPVIQLPAATVGMVFPIVSATTYSVYINPNGTDTIQYASLAAGHSIYNSSAAKGDSITLYCVVAGEWAVSINSGTWATGGNMGD